MEPCSQGGEGGAAENTNDPPSKPNDGERQKQYFDFAGAFPETNKFNKTSQFTATEQQRRSKEAPISVNKICTRLRGVVVLTEARV